MKLTKKQTVAIIGLILECVQQEEPKPRQTLSITTKDEIVRLEVIWAKAYLAWITAATRRKADAELAAYNMAAEALNRVIGDDCEARDFFRQLYHSKYGIRP